MKIQLAVKNQRIATLADVQRGEKGVTCHTCGDRLVVKDGGGQFVAGKGPRHQGRGKHFSHTSNSRCHGEGPAHYRIKTTLCRAINDALKMPGGNRNFHGSIAYLCPDPDYGPNDVFKDVPGSGGLNQEFEQMRHGYHHYDLLRIHRLDGTPALDRAQCEVWLGGRQARADIAGLDKDGNVLWVIEIQRSGLSQAAIKHTLEKGIPLFVVDLTRLPQPTADDPMAETMCDAYFVLEENLARGFYPSVNKSFNTGCERKTLGMGPDDHRWSRWWTYAHRGPDNCDGDGCPDCEEVVLHECGGLMCPDTAYAFEHDIDHLWMYTDPTHRANSHIPQSPPLTADFELSHRRNGLTWNGRRWEKVATGTFTVQA